MEDDLRGYKGVPDIAPTPSDFMVAMSIPTDTDNYEEHFRALADALKDRGSQFGRFTIVSEDYPNGDHKHGLYGEGWLSTPRRQADFNPPSDLEFDLVTIPKPAPYLCIVFDGPPSAKGAVFVEVEDADGKGINIGEWEERPDGFWHLRIPMPKAGASNV